MLGDRYLPECVARTAKFGGASVMIWGCLSWFGLRPLVLVNRNMNSDVYVNVYVYVLLTMRQQFGIGSFHYQPDNPTLHKAKVIILWLEENRVDVRDRPAQSPDLSPI